MFQLDNSLYHILQFFLQVEKTDNFKGDVFNLGAKKAQNIIKKNIVANSIKTLKVIHIQEKKNLRKKKLYKIHSKEDNLENSLAVQWVGLHSFTAKGKGSIPGRGTKVPQAKGHGQKKKKKSIEEDNFVNLCI